MEGLPGKKMEKMSEKCWREPYINAGGILVDRLEGFPKISLSTPGDSSDTAGKKTLENAGGILKNYRNFQGTHG